MENTSLAWLASASDSPLRFGFIHYPVAIGKWYNPYMNARTTIDKVGRLVLPKSIREALQINAGDTLEIESEDDRLVIAPVRVRPGLLKERGVWVYRSGTPSTASIPDLIARQRDRRTQDLIEAKP
jgi:AbrB family looped-hinge helix DNA binding protein